jgi:hypothetical protein
MARRAANQARVSTESLEAVGAPVLASLLSDHAKVDPVLRRKLQLLLASKEDSDKLVAELEKRIRTIGGRNPSSAGRGPRTSSKNWINLRF